MSGVNPTAAGASANAVEAAIALELQALAADAQALRALLMEGDVVQATVQPFNGLTDTLEILGLKVAATLPPDVVPGETLTVAVQGFSGDQVLVQVLSRTPDSSSANATTSEGDSLELTRTPIPIVIADEQSATPQTPQAQPPVPVVAAAESSAPVESPPQPLAAPISQAQTLAPVRAPQIDAPIRPENLDVEARVALARTAGLGPSRVAQAPNPAPAPQRGAAFPNPQPQNVPPRLQSQSVPPRLESQSTPPRLQAQSMPSPLRLQAQSAAPHLEAQSTPPIPSVVITPRAPGAKAQPAPLPGAPTEMRIARMVPASPRAIPAAPTPAELLQDPPALLRTLRIPVTPTTLTFAKLVTAQPEQVATALRALETSLPNSSDPRIESVRTLAEFVGTLDPESPTFTTQLVSYITHVVEGPEQKLIPLVLPDATPPPAQAAAPEPQSSPVHAETATALAPPAAPAAAAGSTSTAAQDASVSAAHVVERTAAAESDLKTQLIGMLASPQAEATLGEAGVAVARNALTALVATQLNSLVAQQTQPGSWTFTVPIAIDQQLYPAKIEISREREGERKELSNDDFHIVFILDTKRLGTVAVDVHAIRRSVSVSVRTERTTAAATFKAALKNLGARLESMRYNVKSLEAAPSKAKEAPSPPADPLTTTDSRA